MVWRTVAPAVILCVLACAAPAHAQTTALSLDSQPGDWVGGGTQHTYTPADGTFQLTTNYRNGVSVSVIGPSYSFWWYLDFGASNNAPLQVGSYVGATRFAFTPFNGLDVYGEGRGCNELTGRFVVREIVYDAFGKVQRFAVDFEQHCEDLAAGLFGALRYNSTVSSLLPFGGAYPSYQLQIAPPSHGRVTGGGLDCGNAGPVCAVTLPSPTTVSLTATPDPGYLFAGWTAPCHGAKTISVNVNQEKQCSALFLPLNASQPATLLYWNSQQGDWVGQGTREVYSPPNSRWTISRTGGGNGLTINIESVEDRSDSYWTLNFAARSGTTLGPGTYDNAVRFSSATQPSLDVWGNGRGCNSIAGSFTVWELTVVSGVVTSLALDFEQNCEGIVIPGRPLRGSIRYNSLVPSRPTVAVTTTGSGAQVTLSPPESVCVGKCVETYIVGSSVLLRPTPQTGWTLSSWSGDADCTDGVVTLDAPVACNATFVSATLSAVSATPNAGSGATQNFALQYSDSLGATDLRTAWVWFMPSLGSPTMNSCLLYYERPSNTLFLLNDAQSWMSGALGGGGTLQNSQCAVNVAASSATANGNSLTLNLAMTFMPSYAGAKNVFMYALSAGGGASGWQDRGDWTVPSGPVAVVTADSVSPNSGSGATQTFALQYSDALGATDLRTTWVWFNVTLASSSANSCLLYYDRPSNVLFLLNDAATQWQSATLGSATTLQNSQCAVAVGSSAATLGSTTLTLNLAMTFKPGFAGAKNVFMYAASAGGVASGWQDRGDWTVPSGGAPVVTADSVTPDNATGATQTFGLLYSDSLGATDLVTTWVWFNPTLASSAANSCLLYYHRASNVLFLLNDAATSWLSATLGSATLLQNSQCAVNVGNSTSLPLFTNTLALNLRMTFTGAYQGATQNIFMYAAGTSVNSGWQLRGTVTVP